MSPSITQNVTNRSLTQTVLGSRRLSNYWWATVTLVGGVGFLLASLSSYFQVNLLPFAKSIDLVFVPQGVAMGFYGVAGILLSLYLWSVIFLDVGSGFNRFDQESGKVTIFRKGFLGKNRTFEVTYPLEDVQAVRAEIKEGLNPRRVLYLRVKGKGEFPLTPAGQPMALSRLENQGAELARFLGVPLEGL
jgi:hypothetical protein